MENEYIYFARNKFYKDEIVKIGWTRNEPKMRAKSLYNTSVPCEFDFEFIIKTPCGEGYNIENKIHNYLEKYRINKRREFFKINKEDLIMILTDELNLEITYELSNNIEEIVEEKQEEIVEEKQEDLNEYNTIYNYDPVLEKYICDKCQYNTSNKYNYKKHLLTDKHILLMNGKKKVLEEYNCDICDYNTKVKSNYTKHLLTVNHIYKSDTNKKSNNNKIYKCSCGKTYKYDSGYYRHKKTCIPIKNKKDTENNVNIRPELLMELIKNNNEFKNIIIEQNNTINNIVKNNVITNI